MSKVKHYFLLSCLLFMAGFCYSNNVSKHVYDKKDGHPIIIITRIPYSGVDKGSSIQASIDSHYLAVSFTENLGQVQVEVTTDTGGSVDCLSTQTPNGMSIYIPLAGDYIVNFTLPNGDEYYGEFTVTE
ncbi:MAG: DUF3244 domain-containing protein [Bacteroidales bacterium]|nr:DUF3244 domain-containing protein [Bacteroidales bacterium]MBR4469462.1 DUF3244 domain-containing protein [Bacteroidales bacterium]